MTEKSKYKVAFQLMNKSLKGRKEAAVIFQELADKANNTTIKMQSILALVVLLNHVDHNKQILEACEKGIDLARKLKDLGSVAYLTAIKAKCIENHASIYNYKMLSLSSALGWFDYSLEADKNKAEKFAKKAKEKDQEAMVLLEQSIEMAGAINRPDAVANIYMMAGQIYGGIYSTAKIKRMRHPKIYLFFHKFNLNDIYMEFVEKDYSAKESIRKSEELLLKAAEIFEKLNDKTNQSYAYYNLANQLRTARKFKKASEYLKKSEEIALLKNDTPLLESIAILRKSIKAKNKDTPDYINGERRDN